MKKNNAANQTPISDDLAAFDGLLDDGLEIGPPAGLEADAADPDAGRRRTTRTERIVTEDLTYRRRPAGRKYQQALEVENAANQLTELPGPGWSTHIIMRGNWHGWDIVPAILRLAAPATITELYVATLGFNRRNALELLGLLDGGEIGSAAFVCSCYFRDANPGEYQVLADGLEERGQRVLAMRNHAKLILARLSDDRPIVTESSANLRSCRNVEQLTIHQDEGLYQFHAAWLEDMIEGETYDQPRSDRR